MPSQHFYLFYYWWFELISPTPTASWNFLGNPPPSTISGFCHRPSLFKLVYPGKRIHNACLTLAKPQTKSKWFIITIIANDTFLREEVNFVSSLGGQRLLQDFSGRTLKFGSKRVDIAENRFSTEIIDQRSADTIFFSLEADTQ